MSSINPYQSPETDVSALRPAMSSGAITQIMRDQLKGAAGWMRFLGIMGFISCGFTVLAGGVFMLFLTSFPFMQMYDSGIEDFAANIPGVFGSLGGFFYILSALLMFFPARFLHKAGSQIRVYMRTGMDSDLEDALRNNRKLWKFLGVVTIVSIAIIPVLAIVGIVVAVSAAAFM
ncbi:MAG: hypothetical protein LBK44_07480 [Spirochaetales bacterium]|jgi:magnesium-transporting ATPase (P-type)|nr:hypothetical protein [Spirochaetales bacterium]